jgi:excinuclease UvrABC nuclease subunit
MNSTVNWSGHLFEVCNKNSNWSNVPGIYIFTGLNAAGKWRPFYIGQAQSLSDRIPNHEQWAAAVRLGATHVHAKVVQQAATRDSIEKELIQAYQPALNVQLK